MPHDPQQPIVTPQAVTRLQRPVDERVLLFPLRIHLNAFLARTGRDRKLGRRFNEARYFPPPAAGRPGVFGPFMGSPLAAGHGEELIALGARELVFFGLGGSLHPDVRLGDVLLVDAAYSDEGTSRHYRPVQRMFAADAPLAERLAAHLARRGIELKRGAGWTTDALYRETRAKVDAHRAAGRQIVEMELSALYCVAEYHGVAAAGIVVVSDELFGDDWRHGLFRPRCRRSVAATIAALAEW
ncbi:MAG: nucleoside phosphorylase [Myxococcales bacterium]|nr:nucleoside phosphorylase [Myxococcales bacterium]